jgi:hypothetical protein
MVARNCVLAELSSHHYINFICGYGYIRTFIDGIVFEMKREAVCLSVCTYLSICLSVCLTTYPSVRLSVYLSICLSVYLSTYLSTYLHTYVPTHSSIHPSVCLSHFSFLIFTQSVRLIGQGISPPQGRYLLRTTQTRNKHKHPCLECDFEPTFPAFEQAKTVHALDRAATAIGGKEAV